MKTGLLIPVFNENPKIGRVLERVREANLNDFIEETVVIDDGSSDGSADVASDSGATVLTMPRTRGVGVALRTGLHYLRKRGYEAAVIMAGNDKDEPAEIPALLEPLRQDAADFVIGSRYMAGGSATGSMPVYRRLATRLHPWLMSLAAGRTLTESTNGFRAIRLSLLDDQRINLRQRWLDGYGLEVYLLLKTVRLGYRHAEVPCTKTYPPKAQGQTKIPPVTGWWELLKPVCLLGLGLRR